MRGADWGGGAAVGMISLEDANDDFGDVGEADAAGDDDDGGDDDDDDNDDDCGISTVPAVVS